MVNPIHFLSISRASGPRGGPEIRAVTKTGKVTGACMDSGLLCLSHHLNILSSGVRRPGLLCTALFARLPDLAHPINHKPVLPGVRGAQHRLGPPSQETLWIGYNRTSWAIDGTLSRKVLIATWLASLLTYLVSHPSPDEGIFGRSPGANIK